MTKRKATRTLKRRPKKPHSRGYTPYNKRKVTSCVEDASIQGEDYPGSHGLDSLLKAFGVPGLRGSPNSAR
jgi:hypothetical protein